MLLIELVSATTNFLYSTSANKKGTGFLLVKFYTLTLLPSLFDRAPGVSDFLGGGGRKGVS